MENLSAEDFIKLATKSKKFRDLIGSLSKVAADSSTEFDEKVPATEDESATQTETPKKPEEQKPEAQAQPPAAVPVAPEAAAPVDTPEAAGARAAQAFIGPEVMQAAVSGDPGAQDLVARTAGQVAGSVTEAAARAVAGSPTAGIPAEAGAEGGTAIPGAQAVPATPEEAVADQVVPPPAPGAGIGVEGPGKAGDTAVVPPNSTGPAPAAGPVPPATPAGPVAAPAAGGGPVDPATVAKLIELAKAGKI